jgi:hypothetical protein
MRRKAALAALLLAMVLTGCAGLFGPSEIPEEELTRNASYDWETNASTTYNLSERSYTAVIEVENRSALEVFGRNALGLEDPVRIQALRFRFENGTVVNATHPALNATVTQERTVVNTPARNGTVGYSDQRRGKEFTAPVFVEGSHELVLPPGTRARVPLLSSVRPRNVSRELVDDRMHLRWGNVTTQSIHVSYYLQRDLWLFGGLFALAITLGVGGAVYYYRQIKRLERRREAIGLDVDDEVDELDDDRPPPGMG